MQRLSLHDVPTSTPRIGRQEDVENLSPPGPGAALVRPVAVATCDLDVAPLTGRFPLQGPAPSVTRASRLAIATALGTQVTEGPPPRKVGAFPITVDASGTPEGLRCALNSTAFDGTCTSPSVYIEDPPAPMKLVMDCTS